MNRHSKTKIPSDKDLVLNPMIGGSKGLTMSGADIDDLEELAGENTIEGDRENDTTPQGGLIEDDRREGRPNRHLRNEKPRHRPLQGRKTHEQQLRMLEGKDDVPDARQMEQALGRAGDAAPLRRPREGVRDSEFEISRGGLNQESSHNKHNR